MKLNRQPLTIEMRMIKQISWVGEIAKCGKLILLLLLVNGQWSMVNGQSVAQLYTSANALYKSNQFEPAATAYQKILMQGYHTPEVYYNLGNCYFKQNNIGRAILNFERAHKLVPDDEDITHNLALAKLKTVDQLIPVPQLGLVTSWNNLVSSQSSKGWGVFALVFLWISLIVFIIYYFFAKRSFIFAFSILLFVLSIAAVSLAFNQSREEDNSHTAILLVSNVNVKSAPDANGTNLFTIHEGIKFHILDNVGSWNKIRLEDGKVGWIEKNLFEKI